MDNEFHRTVTLNGNPFFPQLCFARRDKSVPVEADLFVGAIFALLEQHSLSVQLFGWWLAIILVFFACLFASTWGLQRRGRRVRLLSVNKLSPIRNEGHYTMR